MNTTNELITEAFYRIFTERTDVSTNTKRDVLLLANEAKKRLKDILDDALKSKKGTESFNPKESGPPMLDLMRTIADKEYRYWAAGLPEEIDTLEELIKANTKKHEKIIADRANRLKYPIEIVNKIIDRFNKELPPSFWVKFQTIKNFMPELSKEVDRIMKVSKMPVTVNKPPYWMENGDWKPIDYFKIVINNLKSLGSGLENITNAIVASSPELQPNNYEKMNAVIKSNPYLQRRFGG